MNVLGINAYHADVSATLVHDGTLAAAVEEERFQRVKHWAGLPAESMRTCLEIGGVAPEEVDHFGISRNPWAQLWRKALFALTKRPRLDLVKERLKNTSRIRGIAARMAGVLGLPNERVQKSLHWVEHHPAHLASAFFVSPFEKAAVCAIDGFGDFVSTSFAIGEGAHLKLLERVYFPHSLGILYLAITQYLGFHKYGDEHKVMGLASYGEPRYIRELRQLLHLKPDGLFELDLAYFRHWSEGLNMTWDDGEPTLGPVYAPQLERLLGPARRPEDPLLPFHEAVAASLQAVFEEAAFHILNALFQRTRLPQLCLAGGCAMNSVANGKIRARTPFREVFIQPAAGDNGTALGAAFYLWNHCLHQPRRFEMEHSFWGPEFGDHDMRQCLEARKRDLQNQRCRISRIDDEDALVRWAAARIAEGKILGWFQGRMEWGARALGNRSILADPRRPDMREIINLKIKFREKFRPFALSILEEALDEYFQDAVPDPFMIQVYPVRGDKRLVIPAVTHVDGSARIQTVNRRTNPLYWKLITAFQKETGVPVLLNTSFNENEPMVYRPSEALDCFLRTKMDMLVLRRMVVEKGEPN